MVKSGKPAGNLGINTMLAHCGNNPYEFHGFVNPPVVRASTVLFKDAETMASQNQKYTYGTHGTPTTDALCQAIDQLEGSAGTLLVPSGLAAVTVPLLAFLESGDHVLLVDTIYNPTRRFADSMLKRLGIEVEYYPPHIAGDIARLIRPNTRVIFTESPGSNTFEIQDIPAIVAVAREHDIITMMDNTWATPLYLKALDFGIDISIHAGTKYPSGHSDVLFGMISSNEKCWKRLEESYTALGMCVNSDDAYQILRGLRTMGLRLDHHQQSALTIARWLEQQPQVARVLHPALESHPDHALWKRDFKGASGVFSIVLASGGAAEAHKLLDNLQLFGLGYSWGGYESLAVHVYLGDRTVAAQSFEGPVIRLQIGLEDTQDLINDLKQGLTIALPQ